MIGAAGEGGGTGESRYGGGHIAVGGGAISYLALSVVSPAAYGTVRQQSTIRMTASGYRCCVGDTGDRDRCGTISVGTIP